MQREFPERDWKIFRPLSRVALDRFCARVLEQIASVSADTSKTNHERYLEIYRLIHDRDEELAQAFNGLSRSMAMIQLMLMVKQDLIAEDELAQFSESTRNFVKWQPS